MGRAAVVGAKAATSGLLGRAAVHNSHCSTAADSGGHAWPVVELASGLLRLDNASVGAVEELENVTVSTARDHNPSSIKDEERMPIGAVSHVELVPDTFVAMCWMVQWQVLHLGPAEACPQQPLLVVVLLSNQEEPPSDLHIPVHQSTNKDGLLLLLPNL